MFIFLIRSSRRIEDSLVKLEWIKVRKVFLKQARWREHSLWRFFCICLFQCVWKFHLPMWKVFLHNSSEIFPYWIRRHCSCRVKKRKWKANDLPLISTHARIFIAQIKFWALSTIRSTEKKKKSMAFTFVYRAKFLVIFSFLSST